MNSLEIQGKAEKLRGEVKEAFGKAVNDPKAIAEGKAQQLTGEIKQKAAAAEEEVWERESKQPETPSPGPR